MIDVYISLSFTQFRTISIHKQRQMCVLGWHPFECSANESEQKLSVTIFGRLFILVQQQMFCRRCSPFDSSQDVRNFHQVIVDNIRKMVRRIAIRFNDDRVAFRCRHIVHYISENQVLVVVEIRVQFESDGEDAEAYSASR